MKTASAKLKNIRISHIKLNEVANLIRGKEVLSAVTLLSFSKKRVAGEVKKLLLSALSNADYNHGLDVDNLVVDRVEVGKSLVMKRFRARARGRGARILKRFSNMKITLREV